MTSRWRGLFERAGRTRYLVGDKGYDADSLRRSLRDVGVAPAIPGHCNRNRAVRCDKQRYRARDLIEDAFCRLKDFLRFATCYKLGKHLPPAALATAVAGRL